MRILILCTGNSCRSQMAEGFFRHYLKRCGLLKHERDIRSAGIQPHGVSPTAIKVMKEVGIDISSHTSNDLKEYLGEEFDIVITVCDNAASKCPAFPGSTQKLHWPFEDPARAKGSDTEILEVFRRVRDQIGEKIKDWVDLVSVA